MHVEAYSELNNVKRIRENVMRIPLKCLLLISVVGLPGTAFAFDACCCADPVICTPGLCLTLFDKQTCSAAPGYVWQGLGTTCEPPVVCCVGPECYIISSICCDDIGGITLPLCSDCQQTAPDIEIGEEHMDSRILDCVEDEIESDVSNPWIAVILGILMLPIIPILLRK